MEPNSSRYDILLDEKYTEKVAYFLRKLRYIFTRHKKCKISRLSEEDIQICISILNILGYKYTLSNGEILIDSSF